MFTFFHFDEIKSAEQILAKKVFEIKNVFNLIDWKVIIHSDDDRLIDRKK